MAKENPVPKGFSTLYNTVSQILEEARNTVYRTANFAMVQAYWNIGKAIVEEEQNGEERAEYGSRLMKLLSKELTAKYKKGFDESNLRHMRNFYLTYQKYDALRPELSWTHYRLLLKVENDPARQFYMREMSQFFCGRRDVSRPIPGDLWAFFASLRENSERWWLSGGP